MTSLMVGQLRGAHPALCSLTGYCFQQVLGLPLSLSGVRLRKLSQLTTNQLANLAPSPWLALAAMWLSSVLLIHILSSIPIWTKYAFGFEQNRRTSLPICFGVHMCAFFEAVPRGGVVKASGIECMHIQLQRILPNRFLKRLSYLAFLPAMLESPS